jgi:N-acetylmuramoyl-L-alanine amidase
MRFLITLALILPASCFAGRADVQDLRVWPAPDNTRVVFDVSAPVQYQLFTLEHPNRVVVDIKDARAAGRLGLAKGFDKNLLTDIRYGRRGNGDLRVVLDVTRPVKLRSTVLKPNQQYGNRLVIDLVDENSDATGAPPPVAQANIVKPTPAATTRPSARAKPRDIVVAVDAGHGGDDPGATGPHGTHEKDVVLQIARKLAAVINAEDGMRAVLTRNGDYFIPLRQRMEKARAMKADLFVSIHADSYRDPRVGGSSVYVLSQRGASSEQARWLADQENASDLIGGVTLDNKDNLLKSVLLDLSQTASIDASIRVADDVLEHLDDVGKIRKRQVQHAGFVVLKSPDIPSILVETAYITNPTEERNLRSPGHQEALAKAIASGIDEYFENNPPPGTLLAMHRQNRVADN